jgi:hypothetical protein
MIKLAVFHPPHGSRVLVVRVGGAKVPHRLAVAACLTESGSKLCLSVALDPAESLEHPTKAIQAEDARQAAAVRPALNSTRIRQHAGNVGQRAPLMTRTTRRS